MKMLTVHWLKDFFGKNFNFYVLGVVLIVLAAGIVASVFVSEAGEDESGSLHR